MGSIGANKGTTTSTLSGKVTFEQIMSVRPDVKIHGSRIFTVSKQVSANVGTMTSGKKSELSNLIGDAKTAVIDFYNDKSGANDLKRMRDLGFEVIAEYTPANDRNSSVPARHYYYMRRK